MSAKLKILIVMGFSVGVVTPAFALNALQLGPSGTGWSYNTTDQTWYNNQANFTLNAYANATKNDGGNGDYAWGTTPDSMQYAYLVASATPKQNGTQDLFTLNITNTLGMITSGYGNPPIEDTNDLAPHGIFDTYFEIYEFRFDGPLVDINDTQPGQTGTGKGYLESFLISWTQTQAASDAGGLSGIHFDLFTVSGGNGARYIPSPTAEENKKLVQASAPFSHDAQSTTSGGGNPGGPCLPGDTRPECNPSVPEPNELALLGIGLFGMGAMRKFSGRGLKKNT